MEIYFRQQIDNSHVVRMVDPRRRREQRVYLYAVVVLFLLGFGYASMRFATVHLGYQLEHARQQEAKLQQWNRGLQLQAAALGSPARVYSLAQTRLGMQSALPGQVLALDVAPMPQAAPSPVMASLH
ncbi:MAG: cell division protein FtsL [Terriglobales bacterium]